LSVYELVADLGELRRCSRSSPIRREVLELDLFTAQIIGYFCYSQDKVDGRIVFVEMDEVLQQRKGLVL
jgi:hypothetical protein